MAVKVPFAEWRPLPEAEKQAPINPRTVIFHTAVGMLRGTEQFFKVGTGIEAHMMVGGPWDAGDLDGVTWQWMDLARRADANLDASAFAISIETSDNAPQRPEDIEPWSAKQLVTLVRLGNWLADRFDIPRRQCPAWNAAGFGWHAMWGAPSHWTPSSGKVCPGPARIHQLKTIVFPAIFTGRPPQVEEDMAQIDGFSTAAITQLVGALDRGFTAGLAVGGQSSSNGTVQVLLDEAKKTNALLADLLKVLTPAPPPPPEPLPPPA